MSQDNFTDDFDAPPEADLLDAFRRTAPALRLDVAQLATSTASTTRVDVLRASPSARGFRGFQLLVGVAASLLVAVALWSWLSQPPSLMAQVALQLKNATSFRCTFTKYRVDVPGTHTMNGAYFWASHPNSFRVERKEKDKVVGEEIRSASRPGIAIDHEKKTFVRTPANYGSIPPFLSAFEKLAQFRGEADRDLGKSQIEGREVQGFEISLSRIDPDAGPHKLRVWFDPNTKRPVRLEVDVPENEESHCLRCEKFVWDEPTDNWFALEPPRDYADATPRPAKLDETKAQIISALRIYAQYSRGHYPKVQMVYGDVTCDELGRMAGIKNTRGMDKKMIEEQIQKQEYVDYLSAQLGFAVINQLQLQNSDAAYYGRTIGPDDKDKILLRWKLEGGDYQVIFGDLHDAIVSPQRLRDLEKH